MKPAKQPRNRQISYIKGWAIISVILIHLIDWSNIKPTVFTKNLKELLFCGVLFFVSTAGSVIYIAYKRYDDLWLVAKKLSWRFLQLVGVYYAYNIIKFFIYDFSVEPFYLGFINNGKFNLIDILTLRSFAVPISIILTIGLFLLVGPVLLYISKKNKLAPYILFGVLVTMIVVNYFVAVCQNNTCSFLLGKNNVTYPVLLWFVPFLTGYIVAHFGFENKKHIWLAIFGGSFLLFLIYKLHYGQDWRPSNYMYPLRPYYVLFSFALMSILFYIFYWVEKINCRLVNLKLSCLRILGDFTLYIYVCHWIVVDIIIWIFKPHYKLIWPAVGIYFLCFLLYKKQTILNYSNELSDVVDSKQLMM